MKRLAVVVVLAVAAAMGVAPSVAGASASAPVKVSPARWSWMPARPETWRAMWLTAGKSSPVWIVAPMPRAERVGALRIDIERIVLLKLRTQAR